MNRPRTRYIYLLVRVHRRYAVCKQTYSLRRGSCPHLGHVVSEKHVCGHVKNVFILHSSAHVIVAASTVRVFGQYRRMCRDVSRYIHYQYYPALRPYAVPTWSRHTIP